MLQQRQLDQQQVQLTREEVVSTPLENQATVTSAQLEQFDFARAREIKRLQKRFKRLQRLIGWARYFPILVMLAPFIGFLLMIVLEVNPAILFGSLILLFPLPLFLFLAAAVWQEHGVPYFAGLPRRCEAEISRLEEAHQALLGSGLETSGSGE